VIEIKENHMGPNYPENTEPKTNDEASGLVEPVVMRRLVEDMNSYTDCMPWYWIAYGDKCYAFAVVEAIQMNEDDPLPTPGTKLEMHPELDKQWIGENGTLMFINSFIADIEDQNGGTVCHFIAASHAHFMKDSFDV
jgi:hypothetical protein